MFESVADWLAPTYMFLLVNILILTIFLLSRDSGAVPAPDRSRATAATKKSPAVAAEVKKEKEKEKKKKSSSSESEEELERRRPATSRAPERRRPAGARVDRTASVSGDVEVDARANDFINKFKDRLEMEKMESIKRRSTSNGNESTP